MGSSCGSLELNNQAYTHMFKALQIHQTFHAALACTHSSASAFRSSFCSAALARTELAMDPLGCLRDFCSKGRTNELKFSDGGVNISFGDDYEFSSTIETRFKSSGKNEPYPLGALVFFIQHPELGSASYITKASEARVATVLRADQQVRSSTGRSSAMSVSDKHTCTPVDGAYARIDHSSRQGSAHRLAATTSGPRSSAESCAECQRVPLGPQG